MPESLDQAALDTLLEMVGDDPEFVDELVDAYLADAPLQISELRDAAIDGAAAGLVRPAHALKGASASIGARAVESICREIEERGRAGSTEGIPRLLEELDRAYDGTVVALAEARPRRWAAS